MSWRQPLILAVILAALGGYVYFGELQRPGPTPTPFPGQPRIERQITVISGEADDLQSIQLRAPEGRATVVRPPGGSWIISEPVVGEADALRMSAIANAVMPLLGTRELPADDLAGFGLQAPTTVLTLQRKDGTRDDLFIGDATAFGDGVYVRRGQTGPVFIVPRQTIDLVRVLVTNPPLPRPTPSPAVPTPTPAP